MSSVVLLVDQQLMAFSPLPIFPKAISNAGSIVLKIQYVRQNHYSFQVHQKNYDSLCSISQSIEVTSEYMESLSAFKGNLEHVGQFSSR